MQLSQLGNKRLLALALWGEARGEFPEGKVAVAHVILNRAAIGGWYGKSIADVILKPGHFSCFNDNTVLMKFLETNGVEAAPESFDVCEAIADIALKGLTNDPTGGATHYHAATMEQLPWWAPLMIQTARIGGHIFYK